MDFRDEAKGFLWEHKKESPRRKCQSPSCVGSCSGGECVRFMGVKNTSPLAMSVGGL